MKKQTWWWIGGGVVGAGAVGYGLYRVRENRINPTVPTTSSIPTTTHATVSVSKTNGSTVTTHTAVPTTIIKTVPTTIPTTYTHSSVAPSTVPNYPSFTSEPHARLYTEFGVPVVGPGNGNQPNGEYILSTFFIAPTAGTYTIQAMADDDADLFLDGHNIGNVSYNQTFQVNHKMTGTVTLSAGMHTLIAHMVNNNIGTIQVVHYVTANANPTGLYLTVTGPNGQVLVTTASAAHWYYSGYIHRSALPVSYMDTSSMAVAIS